MAEFSFLGELSLSIILCAFVIFSSFNYFYLALIKLYFSFSLINVSTST